MEKKVINIGDTFLTEMSNLQGLKLVNINTIKDIEETFEESDKYIYKSIFPERIKDVPEVASSEGKMFDCPIFIKYIGEGKFEEMETGTIILCQGSREMEAHELADDVTLKFRPYAPYESYEELNKDIEYIRNNPLTLYNSEAGMIKPIEEVIETERLQYMKYSKEDRIETINKIRTVALNKFNESVKKQVEVDQEMAILENQIESFNRK